MQTILIIEYVSFFFPLYYNILSFYANTSCRLITWNKHLTRGFRLHIAVLVKLGHSCFLCKNDLAHSPLLTEEESESESELESDKLPDVAVLPCGHAFHTLCLEQVISEYELKDPSCFICTSLQ